MKSLGVALGGGGLKGLAHIGVLQVLSDERIKPAYISGTSAGSIIAALYASGISPYKIEQIVNNLSARDYLDYNISGLAKYLLKFLLPGCNYSLDGIITGNKIEKLVYKLTGGKKLLEIDLPLAIVACDIDSGRKIIFTNHTIKTQDDIVIKDALLSEAVRSSISIPVTFQPKQFRGMQMVDGGLKDIVPVMVNKYMGAEYVLGINLGKEIYQTKVSGIPQIISRTLSIMTFETSDTEEEFFADMLLYPGIGDISLIDLKDAPQIIRAGRRAMRESITKLKTDLA
ncbi:MAG: patatin-like phospholipase family protein [Syntrophomonadaceae bacterium]|nr:patatin-like phospholipase family protein [Syntrophomonadaceae bacterium]